MKAGTTTATPQIVKHIQCECQRWFAVGNIENAANREFWGSWCKAAGKNMETWFTAPSYHTHATTYTHKNNLSPLLHTFTFSHTVFCRKHSSPCIWCWCCSISVAHRNPQEYLFDQQNHDFLPFRKFHLHTLTTLTCEQSNCVRCAFEQQLIFHLPFHPFPPLSSLFRSHLYLGSRAIENFVAT